MNVRPVTAAACGRLGIAAFVALAAAVWGASPATAAVVGVSEAHMPGQTLQGGAEKPPLLATLGPAGLGHTVVEINAANRATADVDVFIGRLHGDRDMAPTAEEIAAGARYIVIGYQGTSPVASSVQSVGNSAIPTISLSATHPVLTRDLPASFAVRPLRYYMGTSLYVGHTAVGTPLATSSLTGTNAVLSYAEIGEGRVVFIGFTTYGDGASADAKRVLDNAIEWASAPVPEPATAGLALAGGLCLLRRRVRPSRALRAGR